MPNYVIKSVFNNYAFPGTAQQTVETSAHARFMCTGTDTTYICICIQYITAIKFPAMRRSYPFFNSLFISPPPSHSLKLFSLSSLRDRIPSSFWLHCAQLTNITQLICNQLTYRFLSNVVTNIEKYWQIDCFTLAKINCHNELSYRD